MTVLTVSTSTNFSGQLLTDVDIIDFTNGILDFTATATFAHTQFLGATPQIRTNVNFDGSGTATGITAFGNQVVVNGGSVDASDWSFTNWFANDSVTLNGSDVADTIIGSVLKDTINGGDGNDVITGGLGADVLNGGSGNDSFLFQANDIAVGEIIDGGLGTADELVVKGNVILSNATITAVERLVFSSGNTVGVSSSQPLQFGAEAINRIFGGLGKDILSITGTNVDLSALTFTSWSASDVIQLDGTTGADILTGSERNDTLTGGNGNDALFGGAGNDRFVYNLGSDVGSAETIDGGSGTADAIVITAGNPFDFSALANLTGVEVFDFGKHSGVNDVSFGGDQLNGTAIRRIVGNANADDGLLVFGASVNLSGVNFQNWTVGVDAIRIQGSAGAESNLIGSRENDTITGGSLDDVMQGHAGADEFFGGDGIDTVSYSLSGAVVIDLKANTATGSHAEGDSFAEIENLTGSRGADSLTGDDNANRLNGGGGADILKGGLGVDALFGGDGNDSFVYSQFNQVAAGEMVRGGNGTADKIVVATGNANQVDFSTMSILDVEQLTFDDGTVQGGFAQFDGGQIGAGVRSINSVNGSSGSDRIDVIGQNVDLSLVTFSNWSASDIIIIRSDSSLSSNLVGSSQSDFVDGGSVNDTLSGGAGDDELTGAGGRDIMTGDAGNDDFKFNNSSDSAVGPDRDVITDFSVAAGDTAAFVDRIRFNFFSEGEPDSFISSDAFTAEGQVRAIQSGVNTLIQVNLTGTSGAEMEILLRNFTATDLTSADFIF